MMATNVRAAGIDPAAFCPITSSPSRTSNSIIKTPVNENKSNKSGKKDGTQRSRDKAGNQRNGNKADNQRSGDKREHNKSRRSGDSTRSFPKSPRASSATSRRKESHSTGKDAAPSRRSASTSRDYKDRKPYRSTKPSLPASHRTLSASDEGTTRLNKFIAHAGICSRRDADTFISEGKVRINGKVCKELGFQVQPGDKVTVDGQNIEPEPFVYFLMNKPRDTITTTSDEKGRKTVLDLIENATGRRVYPVGRLDRNTTGLILLTNDGDLANRLMHPSFKVRKVYDVETNRMLTDEELHQLRTGIALEDGPAKAYRVSRHPQYLNVTVLSMHEGRNRVVRRMMEALGVEVVSLDRTGYGALQKKGLRTGRWRNLRKNEINELRKMVRLLPLDRLDRK